MRFIRKTSTSRLVAISTAVVAVGGASVAVAAGALAGDGTKPPDRPLAEALAAAAAAPPVPGVSARVKFTNALLPSGIVGGNSPLLAGGTGRLWLTNDGRFRLELQSPSGDAQVVGDGASVTVSQPSTSTTYRFLLPPRSGAATADTSDTPPGTADIQRLLDRVAGEALVSGAIPASVAGQPAYDVRVAPAKHGGLLGAIDVAWDAARGVPLRVGIYARGAARPTLELAVTDISFGKIPASRVALALPAGGKVETIDLGAHRDANGKAVPGHAQSPAQVQAALAFPLRSPGTLAGLARASIRGVGSGADASALAVYGEGLGSIVVLEQKAAAGAASQSAVGGLDLPTVSIAGASGTELTTSLGSLVRVSKGGVEYTVLGSVPAAGIEAAARELVG
jgi:outer membrane lipoprotein-sorting protein